MPAAAKESTKSGPEFPRLEDVSERYAEACEELKSVRARALKVEQLLHAAKIEWRRALNRTAEPPDLAAVLEGTEKEPPSPVETEARFRRVQMLAKQARGDLAAAETKVQRARSREAGKLRRAPGIQGVREPLLRQMLNGLDATLDAAERLQESDDWLARELASPATHGPPTTLLGQLSLSLDVVKNLRKDIAEKLEPA